MVDHFRYEDGLWEPYTGGGEILPAPGIKITAEVDMGFFGEAEKYGPAD